MLLFQYISYTHLIASHTLVGVESRRGSQHYRLTFVVELAQTPLTELIAVVNGQTRHGIERTHRYGRIDTRYLVQAVNQTLTTLDILLIHINSIRTRSINRGFGNNLTNQRRA